MIVEPQAGRRQQAELRDLGMGDRRHLGGDHAAHRMADEDGLPEPERLQHVERVQGEVEHVAQPVLAARLAVARQQRRDDVILGGEGREQRIARHVAAGAMQKEEVATALAFGGWPRRPRCAPSTASSVRKRDFIRRRLSSAGARSSDGPRSARRGCSSRATGCADAASPSRRTAWSSTALVVGHVADVHQAEDVADAQALDQLLHPLAHRLGRAGDDVAAVDQVLPGQLG